MRSRTSIAVLMLLCLTVAGCGNDDSGSNDNSAPRPALPRRVGRSGGNVCQAVCCGNSRVPQRSGRRV